MTERLEIHQQLIKSMANALFADQMANMIDELRTPSMSGKRYDDHIAVVPRVAFFKASEMAGAIEQANNGKSIVDLYIAALEADGIQDSADFRDEFGYRTALNAIGHGVSWFDNHKEFDFKLPFYLENDIVVGKSDIRAFKGFDEQNLSIEAKEIFDEAPDVSQFSSFYNRDKIVGVAKSAIIDAHGGDYKAKHTAIDSLLLNATQNQEAMCLAHKLIGALYEANRNTIYQLKMNDIGTQALPDKYAISNMELQKYSKLANINELKLGMVVYDWAVKGETFQETFGFTRPKIDLCALEAIQKSAERRKEPDHGLAP